MFEVLQPHSSGKRLQGVRGTEGLKAHAGDQVQNSDMYQRFRLMWLILAAWGLETTFSTTPANSLSELLVCKSGGFRKDIHKKWRSVGWAVKLRLRVEKWG